jgi:raffinose/stachyose/melibiose transport system substrate-binding protein
VTTTHMNASTPPSRRRFLAGISAVGALAALTGCGGSAGAARTEVSFYETKPEAIPYFTGLAKDFTSSQDSIRVIHDTSSNLSASFVRSNPPDLGCLNYNLEMARFMERGALSDLSDMPAADRIRPDVQQLVNQYATYPGRTSVLPYSMAASSVIYNKQLFADHNLQVPATWEELIEVCEKLTAAGVTPIYSTFRDPWTVAQGLFDYTVGGMVDVEGFYDRMHELGTEVGPHSDVSFQKTFLEPVTRMMTLAGYSNKDAPARGYGDGNTAMAQGKAAMYMQGPWAFGEIAKSETDVDLGTFPLPMTDDPADRKVRVNIDLSLWIPEMSTVKSEARKFLSFLMQPEIQNAYNKEFLAFGTTKDAPPVADPRIAQMQDYYDDGRFYMGASQFIPRTIPAENYIQAIANGASIEGTLRRLDQDWARLAFRQ